MVGQGSELVRLLSEFAPHAALSFLAVFLAEVQGIVLDASRQSCQVGVSTPVFR